MSDPFLGEIRLVGFSFPPVGWASANGALIGVAQNQALFALLGTTFGGNGQQTFGLPDYRGRTPVGIGQGPGLPPVVSGELAGTPSVTLLSSQLPIHTVQIPEQNATVSGTTAVAVPVSNATATVNVPVNAVLAMGSSGGRPAPIYNASQTGTDTLTPFNASVSGVAKVAAAQSLPVGGSQPISIQSPYLGTNFIIALQGIFPQRQ